jgi:hypothetical protein
MKNRTFLILLSCLVGLGLLLTVAHFLYVLYAYQHCSIIYFIGKELW